MGYYSDVVVSTSIAGYMYILQRIKDHETICKIKGIEPESQPIWKLGGNHTITVNREKNYVILKFEYVKWYDYSGSDIGIMENIFREMRNLNIPINYCKVGEEDGDIELRYDGNDVPNPYPVTEIIVEGSGTGEYSSEDTDFVFVADNNNKPIRIFVIDTEEDEDLPF